MAKPKGNQKKLDVNKDRKISKEDFAMLRKKKGKAMKKTKKDKARKKSYYARHNAQDSSPDKLSARYWSHKVKW